MWGGLLHGYCMLQVTAISGSHGVVTAEVVGSGQTVRFCLDVFRRWNNDMSGWMRWGRERSRLWETMNLGVIDGKVVSSVKRLKTLWLLEREACKYSIAPRTSGEYSGKRCGDREVTVLFALGTSRS